MDAHTNISAKFNRIMTVSVNPGGLNTWAAEMRGDKTNPGRC